MDWLRGAIGIAPPPPSSAKSNAVLERHRREAEKVPHDERAEKFARAQALRIRMLNSELNDEEREARAAVERGDRSAAQRHLVRSRQLRSEVGVLQQKYDNMTQTRNAIGTANANLAQGMLVKEGAVELEQAVSAMEQIDLDEAIDKLQDGAAMLREHDLRLAEPLFVAEDDAEEELERLMREKQERDAARINFPDAPVGEVRAGVKHPAEQAKIK